MIPLLINKLFHDHTVCYFAHNGKDLQIKFPFYMVITLQCISWVTVPLGGLLGGWLGEEIGLRPASIVVIIGLWCALPWLVWSPLRKLHVLPS
jgi:hypothetical protein